jgi:hypothetical protein
MTGRYVVTGVQLGMLQVFFKEGKSSDGLTLLEKILDKQFVGNSSRDIGIDIKLIEHSKTFTNETST